MLKRVAVFFRWVGVWTFPALLLAGAGALLFWNLQGALLGTAYPLWLFIRLLMAGPILREALPPQLESGGRFADLLSGNVVLDVVKEPAAWSMVMRVPFGPTRILLTEGLLQERTTQEICAVLEDLEARGREPNLGLRTLAASLGIHRGFGDWQILGIRSPGDAIEVRLPFAAVESRLSLFAVAFRLVRLSFIRLMEGLLGAPILGGKERLAIHH